MRKKKTTGNNVSHANNKTKKQVLPTPEDKDTDAAGVNGPMLYTLSEERYREKVV